MDSIFETLRQAKQTGKQAADLVGRSPMTQMGIVSNNEDPLGKRRVRVALQSKGAQTETDWLWRLTDGPYDDPPLPRLGQTVVVAFFEGDPHHGCYFGLQTNEPNPERKKENPEKDDWEWIEGTQTLEVKGDQKITVGGDRGLEVEGKWEVTTKEWTYHYTQLIMDDLLRLQLAEGLPTASEVNRGKMLVVKGPLGQPDRSFICLKNFDESYSWKEFAKGATS